MNLSALPQPVLIGGMALLLILLLALIAVLFLEDRRRRVKIRLTALVPKRVTETGDAAQRLGSFGRIIANSPLVGSAEQAKISKFLADAGLSGTDKLRYYIGIKTVIVMVMLVGALVSANLMSAWLDKDPTMGLLMKLGLVVGSLIMGWRLPDLVVWQLVKKRRLAIKNGLADALDLLVICVEAGLGLEQGLDRVSRDLAVANPVIAGELAITVAEMRVLAEPRMALENLGKRSGVPLLQSIIMTLTQALRYGTPLAQSLRILAADMRTHRLLEIEERAARLPVLMTLPLITLILPSLFLIIGGPAVIQIMHIMKN